MNRPALEEKFPGQIAHLPLAGHGHNDAAGLRLDRLNHARPVIAEDHNVVHVFEHELHGPAD